MYINMKSCMACVFALLFIGSGYVNASPVIQTWETSNGVPVYYVHAPELPMVDIQVVFDAGSSRDGDKPGLAMLTTGLLSQGAGGKDADAISTGFESLGAVYGADTGYDSSSISLRSLTEEDLLASALANMELVMTQPDFPEDALERRRSRTLIGLRSKQQSPGSLAQDVFMEAVYNSHPYSKPSEGTEESVKAVTRKDVVGFFEQYFVASNAMVAMVGAVDRDRAEAIAEQLTSVLPKGEKPAALPEVSSLEDSSRVFIPDYFPLYVGNHILGGGGMVSRLFEEVREKRGLSYSAYSYFSPMRFKGPFIAGLQTKTEQADEALSVLLDNIRQFIDNGPTEEELVASKKNITGGYPLRIDSNGKILSYVTLIGFYGLPLDYLDKFNDKVNAVTVEQIRDAFERRV